MGRAGTERGFQQRALALAGTILVGGLSSPAIAAGEPHTQLVRCGSQSCLKVAGHRSDAATVVRVNGHAVAVQGERRWKVYLPVETVRIWSAPNARTIEVSLSAAGDQTEVAALVDLPIGMLAREISLASLVVSVR